VVASGLLHLPNVPAGTAASVDIPGLQYIIHDKSEWFLSVSLTTTTSYPWASAGYEIAWSQFSINSASALEVISSPQNLNYPKFYDTQSTIRLSNLNFAFEFSKATARITKWSLHGTDVFDATEGPEFTFWRAPTDNDIPHDAEMWALFGVNDIQHQVRSLSFNFESSGTFKIVVKSYYSPPILAWGFDTTTTYTVQGDGEIQIHVHAEPRGAIPKVIPRFGLEMGMNKNIKSVKWFGRGPGESYNDKKEAARIGVWTKTVDEMPINYEFPQENGNRTDTRWVHLTNNSGIGIRATLACEKPARDIGFDFNVQRFSAHDIQKAKHPYELGKSDRVIFRIDGGHHGLGTASCGPGTLEQHQLSCQTLDFTVDLVGIRS
jgi:beta-galactosidase